MHTGTLPFFLVIMALVENGCSNRRDCFQAVIGELPVYSGNSFDTASVVEMNGRLSR
jgi:hypothetical protein